MLEPEIKRVVFFIYNSPEDLDLHQFLQDIDIGALPDGDEFEAFMRNWLIQFPSNIPVSGFAALVRTSALYFLEKCLSLLPSLPLYHLELKFHKPTLFLSHLFTFYLINTFSHHGMFSLKKIALKIALGFPL